MPDMFADQLDKSLAHQARLSGTGDARHGDQRSHRECHRKVLEMVPRHAFHPKPRMSRSRRASAWPFLSEQVGPRSRFSNGFQASRRATVKYLPAMLSGRGSDIDNPIRVTDHIQFMLGPQIASSRML